MKISEMIESLNIFANYYDKGLDAAYFFEAEHDQIYMHVGPEHILPDSDDAKRLDELGWHVEMDVYTKYT